MSGNEREVMKGCLCGTHFCKSYSMRIRNIFRGIYNADIFRYMSTQLELHSLFARLIVFCACFEIKIPAVNIPSISSELMVFGLLILSISLLPR